MFILQLIIMSSLHYKKDGTLDMRYKSSREYIQSQSGREMTYPNRPTAVLYSSSDVKLNKDGSVSRRSRAVKSGDITFTSEGRIDPNCRAVRYGRLILDKRGNINQKVHSDLEIRKNPGDYKTSVYRNQYEQKKFRKENHCTDEYDASHIVDLEIAQAILKNKKGLYMTESELHNDMKPLNKLLELRPKSVNRANRENPDNDHAMAQRIIRLLNGEKVPRTRALDDKIVNMIDAIHSIPSYEMNPTIQYILYRLEQIKPQIIQLY